jgi:ribosomal-protein-alanine N-acetyltransferase
VIPRRTLLPLGLGRRLELTSEARGLPPIIGFAGMWVLYDEAHVTTIGVEPCFRGRGLGELLLLTMFDEAVRRHADWLTLEVRVSNQAAQALYRKYGLSPQGTRRRYYSDNNEDALIMWSRPLKDEAYRAELATLRRRLRDRLGHEVAPTTYHLAAGD